MKSLLLLVGGLFISFSAHSQSTLAPYKVTIFRDASQVGWKGIVRFNQLQAEVPLPFDISADGLDLIPGTEDVRITSYRLRQDTVIKKGLVRNWTDILKANISKPVSILYVVGQEFDEVSGTVRLVNAEDKLLLLHGDDDMEYFIPLDQVRQVIVETISDYRIDQKIVQDVLEVNISEELSFVPMEMFTLQKGLSWTPVCRVRILGSDKARLQLMAVIRNNAQEFVEVETDLSSSNMLGEGPMAPELIPVGKLSFKPGDQVVLNVRDTDLEYDGLHICSIPWNPEQSDGQMHTFSVDNTIRFKAPGKDNFPCDQYAVIDENNRSVANMGLSRRDPDGSVTLNLGPEKQLRVTLQETRTRTSRKVESIEGKMYERVSIEGKIACFNVGQKFVRLDLDRRIFGVETEVARGKVRKVGENNFDRLITWNLSLDRGQKKEISFKYDALIPKMGQ